MSINYNLSGLSNINSYDINNFNDIETYTINHEIINFNNLTGSTSNLQQQLI